MTQYFWPVFERTPHNRTMRYQRVEGWSFSNVSTFDARAVLGPHWLGRLVCFIYHKPPHPGLECVQGIRAHLIGSCVIQGLPEHVFAHHCFYAHLLKSLVIGTLTAVPSFLNIFSNSTPRGNGKPTGSISLN